MGSSKEYAREYNARYYAKHRERILESKRLVGPPRPRRRRSTPVIERIMRRIEKTEDGCWEFPGAKVKGYGSVTMGTGKAKRSEYTHRIVYQFTRGMLPPELHLDHLCRNRACCNPEHLEAVTQGENNRRAHAAKREATQ